MDPFSSTSAARELKSKLEQADAEAKSAFARFSKARDEGVKQYGSLDKFTASAEFKAVRALSEEFERKSDVAGELKEQLLASLERGSKGPAAGMDAIPSIGKAFLEGVGTKAIDGTSGGSMVGAFYDSAINELPIGQLFVRSLIPSQAITSDKVDYLVQTVNDNQAEPVPAGDVKPTSVYTVAKMTADVVTIAHVSEPLDRALLADFDSLTEFLDRTMRMGVLLAAENQIVNGAGSPGFTGIVNTMGVLTPTTSGELADQVYQGITAVRGAFYEPDAVVLNPTDLQEIRLSKAQDSGVYLSAGIIAGDPQTLFGKKVIASPVLPLGTALVGAFAQAAKVYDREQDRVTFTESGTGSNGDELFVRNQILFRCESRLAFAVGAPQAIAVLDLGTGGPT